MLLTKLRPLAFYFGMVSAREITYLDVFLKHDLKLENTQRNERIVQGKDLITGVAAVSSKLALNWFLHKIYTADSSLTILGKQLRS
jgi:hypothetical protein